MLETKPQRNPHVATDTPDKPGASVHDPEARWDRRYRITLPRPLDEGASIAMNRVTNLGWDEV